MLTTESEEARTQSSASTRLRPVTLMQRLLQWAGADRAVVYGVMRRIWALATGPVTMLLVASCFTRELQGYYYTFGSLVALSVFIELGLGQTILQFASHEWSRLRLEEHGRIVGDVQALSRLASLGRFAFIWYAVGGVLFAVGVGAAGFIFFARSPQIGIHWVAPWFALCVLSGVNLCLLSVWSLLEGCNQVVHVYAFQFSQAILGSLAIWLAIWCGAGLWTAPITGLVGLLWGGQFLYRRYKNFLRTLLAQASGPVISWRAEILPLQWRLAVTWMSGYFWFYLFTPTLFRFRGPVAAGQMGMTWAMVSALSSISAVWVYAKAPRFGLLVAKKDYAALDRLVLSSGIAAFAVASCGAMALEGLVYFLYTIRFPLAVRMLPPLPTGLFLLATVLMQISYPQAAYLRAYKREPFMGLSVISALLIGLSTVGLGWRYGATGMAAGYLAVVALLVLPVGTIIWYRCRAAWQASVSAQRVTAEVAQTKESYQPVMDKPTLSVIMPNYNHAHYIRESLEAILAQSFRPLEVIVVDDGSTDNSVAVIEEFVRRDPVVRLLRNERNKGVLFSCDRALNHASGDYVHGNAADDKVLPGLYEKSMKLLARYPQAGVCAALTRAVTDDGTDLGVMPTAPRVSRNEVFLPPAKALSAFRRHGAIWHAGNTAIYRRDALIEAGGFKHGLRSYCDAFAFQVLAVKHGACFIPEPLGVLRVSDASFSSELRSIEAYLDLKKHAVQLMRSNYRNVFPEQYVQEFWNESLYSAGTIAYWELKLQHDECLLKLGRSLESTGLIDRVFLSGLRLCMAVQCLAVRLYLFARLRRISWPLLGRKLRSLLK